MARKADLTEGTPIVATTPRPGGAWVRSGVVDYLCRDYDGRSMRTMVMFRRDDTGGVDGAWLNEVRVTR